MTITDTGALVALIDTDDDDHRLVTASLTDIKLPMITTWAVLAEAMYLLIKGSDGRGRRTLWNLVTSNTLRLPDLPDDFVHRCADLMEQYADTPMDLADATLVALAEHLGERDIFTLDNDFRIYRAHGKHPFRLIPG